ncbi:Geranylgeranyl pyrophosphate synthase [Thermoplasmatales archaeon BRNA1]|nr:Geranylgeranyl pyrophosphate synthase [Thermoplasmatales archaeon BRNA1]
MANDWHSVIASEMERVEGVLFHAGKADNPELTEMCQYVLANHGKRVRPAFSILSYYVCGGKDPTRAIDVGCGIELIHNATLIHDDINDQGELRRGAKALYREYALGKSIVCGDYLFALGYKLMGSSSGDLVNFIIEAASGLACGEFSQKKYERNVMVGEAEYMDIISGKTARLIECAAKCGAFLADSTDAQTIDAVGNFAFKAGQAFQIIDDVLDVAGDVSNTGKKLGNDIIEGKPTLPTIYAIEDPSCGARIREVFENPESTREEVAEAIELINKTDSIARCRRLAEAIAESAKSELDTFAPSVYKDCLFDLVDFIVSRDR